MSALTDAIVGFNAKLDTTIDTILGVNSTITSRASAVAANALAAQASEDAARASKEALAVALTTSPNSAALQVNLAAPTGSSLVGANAYQTQDAINKHVVYVNGNGALGNGVANDTAAIQAAIDYASSIATTYNRVRVVFDPSGVYLTDGIVAKSNVTLDFGGAIIRKRSVVPGDISTNSLLCTLNTTGGAYPVHYGSHQNITVLGGIFDTNNVNHPSHVVSLIYCENLLISGSTVLHTPTGLNWAFRLGGRGVLAENLSVKNGTLVYQDGIHIYHGQYINVNNCYVESGDDAIAIGGEPTDGILLNDPDPIRYVNINNISVKAEKAAAIKIYTQAGATGTNWEISDVNINNVSGTCGTTRNGGVWIDDVNHRAYGTTQIKNINITNLNLNVGSATHDEVNATGVYVFSADNVKVQGTIKITDKTGAVSGFRLGRVYNSTDVTLNLNCPAVPKDGGVLIEASKDVSIFGKIIGSAAQTTSSLILVNAENTEVVAQLVNVPNTLHVIGLYSGTLTTLLIRDSKLAHVAGATSGFGVFLTSARLTYIAVNNSDFSGCFAPWSSTEIPNLTAYNFANNRGADTLKRGAAVIGTGATSTTVTHGSALISASTSQILITPDSSWGNATKWWISNNTGTGFNINSDIAPGGSGVTFRWTIDTGRKPI